MVEQHYFSSSSSTNKPPVDIMIGGGVSSLSYIGYVTLHFSGVAL